MIGHAARLFLGCVFLLAGVLKVINPDELAREMTGYGIIGARLAAAAAPLLIAIEITLGVALLVGWQARLTAAAASALLLVFLGAKIYSFARGNTDPCGCFGTYLQTSPGWGIAIDAGFLASGLLTLWGPGRRAGIGGRLRSVAVAAVALLSLGLAIASPRLPIDRFVTRLAVGRSLPDLGLQGKVPGEGRRLVALLDLTDPGAAAIAARLDAIAGEPRAPRVVAITPSSEEDKAAFQWQANPGFAVEHVDFALLNPPGQRPLYRRLPRYFMVAGDRVVAVYDDAPPAASDLISSEAS